MIHRRNNKGRTMARNWLNAGRAAGFVMIIAACGFLADSCGAPPDADAADVTVKVKLIGKESVCLWGSDGMLDLVLTRIRSTTTRPARDSAEKTFTLVTPPGGFLRVIVPGQGDARDPWFFTYRYDGAEKQPLVFSRSGFCGMVNGKPVHLDLTTPKAIAWFAEQPASATRTVQSIHLSGGSPGDARALSHFAGSGVIVSLYGKKDFKLAKQPALARALIAAKPSGLIVDNSENLDKLLTKLPDLEFLFSSGQRIPNLAPLRKLKFFGFVFGKGSPSSLAPLAGATGLQSLYLSGCKATTDFKPIGKHRDLRRLFLEASKMEDLSVLSNMKKLWRLELDCEGLKDISGVRGLQSLRQMAFRRIPDTVKDLAPLESLEGLRILVVDKGDLENRKVEFDRIKKSLPDTIITGFCMGSAWIFIPILAAGFALLRHKQRPAASHLRLDTRTGAL